MFKPLMVLKDTFRATLLGHKYAVALWGNLRFFRLSLFFSKTCLTRRITSVFLNCCLAGRCPVSFMAQRVTSQRRALFSGFQEDLARRYDWPYQYTATAT